MTMHPDKSTSRRNFLKNSSLAGVGALAIPQIISTAFTQQNIKRKATLSKDDVVLFQGDSITDSGRKKDNADANNASALGSCCYWWVCDSASVIVDCISNIIAGVL